MVKIDRPATEAKIMALITWMCGQFNVTNNMNSAQMAYCAEQIAGSVYGINLDDIDLCFQMAVRGEFGINYNRLDMSVIFGWLKEYKAQRMEIAAEMKDKETARNNIYDIFNNDTMHKVLTDVHDKLMHKEQPAVQAEYKPREKHPIEIQIMAEWDEQVKKGNVTYVGSMRMIEVGCVPMTYTEFYNHRFEQLTAE